MGKAFDGTFIRKQKERLIDLKNQLLNKRGTYDLHIPSDQIIEEGDQAQAYLDQNLNFGLKERELHRLREIDAALLRIENGTYGICEETEEPIEAKRLEKMPWTRLSIFAAEELERQTSHLKRMG